MYRCAQQFLATWMDRLTAEYFASSNFSLAGGLPPARVESMNGQMDVLRAYCDQLLPTERMLSERWMDGWMDELMD